MTTLPSIRDLFPESFLTTAGIRFPSLNNPPPTYGSTSPSSGVRNIDYLSDQTQPAYGRLRMSPAQTFVLEEVFRQTSFPSSFTRRRLAVLLDLTPRKVQVWFQNKRQKLRKAN